MKKSILLLLISFIAFSCSNESDDTTTVNNGETLILSNEKEILSFVLKFGNDSYQAEIKNDSILLILPSATDLTKLSPEISISNKATIDPELGTLQDFSNPVTYKVTAENGSINTYKAYIRKRNSQNEILSFSFTNLAQGQANYSVIGNNTTDIDTIYYKVPYLSPIKELTSKIFIPENASIQPQSGETLNYSSPIKYTVTAEDNSKKEYLVIVDNALQPVKIDGITGDIYRNKSGGDVISFNTNLLNPIMDSIHVKLISYDKLTTYDLEINDVDYQTNRVDVILPDTYTNYGYHFKVFIEADNFDESDGFILDAGIPNFKHVADYSNNDGYVPYTTLLIPYETFGISMYLNRQNFAQHEFFLRKNGQDISITNATLDSNFEEVRFTMPPLPNFNIQGGTDFEFIVKYAGQEYAFPLLNSNENPIEIIIGAPPVITSISNTTVTKGGDITIFGDHLYFPFNTSTSGLSTLSTIWLDTGTSGSSISHNELNNDGSMTFNFPNRIKSGTYTLSYRNNIYDFDQIDTGIVINVELPLSDHPTLSITAAKIYSSTDPNTPKQILFSFNGSINGVTIKQIEIQEVISTVSIDNFLVYTSTILTGAMTDQNYGNFYSRLPDGYVVIEDQGVEYTLPFKLTRN